MSFYVYVSHVNPVHALIVAQDLMKIGSYPFVPQLNKLIPGRKDKEWENYYKMWLFKCDCIYLTESFRKHELEWADENKIPSVRSIRQTMALKLPMFGGLCDEFGKELARHMPNNEDWRKQSKEEAKDNLDALCHGGLAMSSLTLGVQVLQTWDRLRS